VAPGELPALELTGIGAVITAKGDILLIGKVLKGNGAEAAGLVTGDVIVTVDGEGVADLGFQGSIQHIRGPEGSTVELGVLKQGAGEPVLVDVQRMRIHY
jgi:carboxyl-terminal processing protease